MIRHIIVHQYDPTQAVASGTSGFIRDLFRHGGPERNFTVVGVARGAGYPLGTPTTVHVGGGANPIEFVPVARLSSSGQPRTLPDTVRLVGGLMRYRPAIAQGVVQFHRAETASAGRLLAGKAPVALFLHGAGQAHRRGTGRESFWSRVPGGIYDRVEEYAVGRADCTFVMDTDKAKAYADRFSQVFPGVNWYDEATFFPTTQARPTDELVIGWVGRLDESKDPVLAVRTLSALAAQNVSFKGWMAGVGPLRADVEEELRACGLSAVEMTGLLSPTELADRLRQTDVCLVTSRWEGIPRAVIEMLACGVPVVSTDVGDIRSVVGPHNGALVSERDPRRLLSELTFVAASRNREAVSRSVRHLRGSDVIPKLLDQLENLIRRRSLDGPVASSPTSRPPSEVARGRYP